jgi:ribonuclease VapC
LIVVDSSAIIAILLKEVDADYYKDTVRNAGGLCMAAPNKLEVMMVVGGRMGEDGRNLAQALIDSQRIEVVPFTEALTDIATDAFFRFGKGRNHSARLNFGDCMAYALAKFLDAPLLYKGGDFALTDIKSAA